MRFDDLLRVSFLQVHRHRRCYWGVMLAIALGTAGFVIMITMGGDLKKNLGKDLDLIGGVTIMKAYFDNNLASRPQWFHPKTVEDLRQLPGVMNVSQVLYQEASVKQNYHRYKLPVFAVDEKFWGIRNYWSSVGRLFGSEAVQERKRECVLGEELAKKMFGFQLGVGSTFYIGTDVYQVVGILGGITDSGIANTAYFPLTTVQDRFPGKNLVDRLYIRCQTWYDIARIASLIPEVVKNHQSAEHLYIEVPWEGLKNVQRVDWWLEFFISMAMGATVILGGVGICNVMTAAVRSRTREIGLKKAMGAGDWDIFAQFLTESLLTSLASAGIGLALGRLGMEIISYAIDRRPPENLFLICLASGIMLSVLLGLGAGLYPAVQASRMEVVTAIRYE